jgi:hypothetical protein
MNAKTNTNLGLVEVDGKWLTLRELALVLYHISRNTQVSRDYTLKFVSDALLRASEVLLEESFDSVPQYEEIDDSEAAKMPTAAEIKELLNEQREKQSFCEYHNAYHAGNIAHECPRQSGKICGCCDAGRQHCMKRRFDDVDIWQRDKHYSNGVNISNK